MAAPVHVKMAAPVLQKSYYQAPSWVPPVQHTIAELLDIRGTEHPDREAIVVRDIGRPRQVLTYGELKDKTERLAAGMIKRGLKKGDCVALLCPTSVEYALCEFALARTGAIFMRCHVGHKSGDDIKYILKKSNCRWLIAYPGEEDGQYNTLKSAIPGLQQHDRTQNFSTEHFEDLETIFMMSSKSFPGTVPWTELFEDIKDIDLDVMRQRQATVEGDDIHGCYATSGSTGVPKLVSLPDRYTTNFFRTILMRNGATGTDRFLTDRPMAYVGGHIGAIVGIGFTFIAVAAQTAKHQSAKDFYLNVINEENATIVLAFAYIMRDFLKKAEDGSLNVSSIKLLLIGGEVIQRPLVEQCLNFVPYVVNCYGGTEDGLVLGTHVKDSREKQLQYTGIGCDGELKIINADGAIVPVGTSGELCVRNNYMFHGYWGDPEKTREVKSETGWFKTNDIAVMNEEGYVTILGRQHELISKAAVKIFPKSIERVLLQHPLVENVIAVGIPHEELFEEICVCFVGKGQLVADADIKRYCLEMFLGDAAGGDGQLPDYVLQFDKFPIGLTDKMDRAKTKAEAIKRLETERVSSRLTREEDH